MLCEDSGEGENSTFASTVVFGSRRMSPSGAAHSVDGENRGHKLRGWIDDAEQTGIVLNASEDEKACRICGVFVDWMGTSVPWEKSDTRSENRLPVDTDNTSLDAGANLRKALPRRMCS